MFVNVRELFEGTQAESISSLLPAEIEKIVAADRTDKNDAEYTIDDPEKIKSFIKIMTDTAWYKPDVDPRDSELNSYWSFEFYSADGKCLSKLDMCRTIFSERLCDNTKGQRKAYFPNYG